MGHEFMLVVISNVSILHGALRDILPVSEMFQSTEGPSRSLLPFEAFLNPYLEKYSTCYLRHVYTGVKKPACLLQSPAYRFSDTGRLMLYFGRVIFLFFFRPPNFRRPWADFSETLPHDPVCAEIVYFLL